jgi:hypothetical protein
MIFDGDQIYSSSVVPSLLSGMTAEGRAVVCDFGTKHNYCSIMLNEDLSVTVAERGGNSPFGIAGGYGFQDWRTFQHLGSHVIAASMNKGIEPKMSAVLSELSTVQLLFIEKEAWTSVGTPEEYTALGAKC